MLAGLAGCGSSPTSPPPARVIGYVLGSRGMPVDSADVQHLTHVNYAFANVTADGRVVLERPDDSLHLARLKNLRAYNPDLKILLSVGGWAWSDHFSDAALTPSARARFAQSAVALLTKHDLDGIDVDWEYPGQPGQDNRHRPEDRENFTRLLRTLRERLDAQSDRDGRTGEARYLLTIAAATDSTYLVHTDMAAVEPVLDFVNLMTYDFYGSWTARTGHHANLFRPKESVPDVPSAAAGVRRFLDAGVPAGKLVLGVPFYGRAWSGVRAQRRGLYQPYDTSMGALPYDSLARHYVGQNGFTRHWDDAAKAPFLWNAASQTFITYEDTVSLRHKAAYVRETGLGGVMYWEHTHDPSGVLRTLLYGRLR